MGRLDRRASRCRKLGTEWSCPVPCFTVVLLSAYKQKIARRVCKSKGAEHGRLL